MIIQRNIHVHVKYCEFPHGLQCAIDFHLEYAGNVIDNGFALKWSVHHNPDYDTDCEYQRTEYLINEFLISQGIRIDTIIYIDL